jgi:ABC transport system ATP-binding/permease protein
MSPQKLPSFFTQLLGVWARRYRIFLREPAECWLQFFLILAFPGLVVLFALQGLPAIKNLSMSSGNNVVTQLVETVEFTTQAGRIGGLVSGLVMFQVVLLTLMASNNGAREIAGERLIFEKEKLAGLRPWSYLSAKLLFLGGIVLVQSIWMAFFVKFTCQLPGDLGSQTLALLLGNAAMTAICLAISAWSKSPEQASLISVYLVGFQIPLSGAILALPEPLGSFIRPLITSYWSWGAYLQTLRETRFYDLARSVTETPIAAYPVCLWILSAHLCLGVILAYWGAARSQWD